MALPATDNFNRADGDLVTGNWGAYFHNHPQILSNAVVPSGVGVTDSIAVWTPDTPANDQYAQIRLVTLNTNTQRAVGVVVRGSAAGSNITGYVALAKGPFGASTTLEILEYTSGSGASLTSTTAAVAANDIMKFTAVGTTLTIYINGVQKLQTTDNSIASGLGGIYLFADAGAVGDATLDDFEVGDVSAAGPALSGPLLAPRVNVLLRM